jgi:trigger factor
VLEALVSARFRTALEERKLRPVSEPQLVDLQLNEGEPLRFKAAFEVLPAFSIDGYQNVKVAKPDASLTDEEFNAELERVRDSRATMEPVTEDRPLADGDWAEINFHGHTSQPEGESAADEKPIEGHGVLIEVGGVNTLPAFNDALRGARPGQELKFEVSYPEDFGERKLAGKAIAYDVEVKAIKKKILPELNDEFAKELGPRRFHKQIA